MGEPVTKASQLPEADAGVLVAEDQLLVRARVNGVRKSARARVDQLPGVAQTVTSVAGRTGAVALDKSDVGLGNLDNTADASKPVSAPTQAALDLKAPLASPAFTGLPTAPTQAGGDDSTKIATTAWVQARIAVLLATPPATLDTLAELAAALGNDPDFAATVTAALAAKAAKAANLSDLADAATARTNLGLGTAATRNAPASGNAAPTEVVLGSDSRLGAGDVTSNTAVSVDGEVAVFNSTTGKQIKRATATGVAKLTSGVLGAATAGVDYARPNTVQTWTGAANVTVSSTTRLLRLTADPGNSRTITLPAASSFAAGEVLWIDLSPVTPYFTRYMDLVRAGADTIRGGTANWRLHSRGRGGLTFVVSDGVSNWAIPAFLSEHSDDNSGGASCYAFLNNGSGGVIFLGAPEAAYALISGVSNGPKFQVAAPGFFGWASAATLDFNSALDTAFSRISAGVIGIGTGGAGSVAGELVATRFRLGSSSGPFETSGSGSPEGVITAPVGSRYANTAGGTGTSFYVKESGSGNTGWVAK